MQETAAEPEVVTEAVAEAVGTAVEASEATDQPAVVEAVVDGSTTAPETTTPSPMVTADGATLTATAATDAEAPSPASEQINGSSAEDAGMTRLFVGCVPYQFSEDDLKSYFQPVRSVSFSTSNLALFLRSAFPLSLF